MSENKTNKIKEKIKIPLLRLWLIWFFLFVFPTIATIIGFKNYNNKYLYFSKTDLIAESFERIKEYNTQIVPENFMEEQLKTIRKFSLNNISAQELKNNIDKTLCGETLFCFFFDKSVNKTVNIKSPKITNVIKNIPYAFIKKNIKEIIESSVLNKTDNSNNKKLDESKAKFGILLQQLFKSITTINISLNKVKRNYSILFGGELYFIFCEFDEPTKDYLGFFAIMRGREFNFHKMLERLNQNFPEIRIIFRDFNVENYYYNQEKLYSGLKNGKNGLFIISPTDTKFARHVIHGGSENLIEQYDHLLPLIEYHIPIEKENESINQKNKQINLIAIILILISGVYTLHISLFGFNDNLSFKNKIMLLALTSALFPFSVFATGLYAIENYNRFIEKASIQQHAETEIELASQELQKFKTDIESKASEYSLKLSELLIKPDLKPSFLLEYLDKIGDDIPASLEIVYFKEVPPNLESICDKNRIFKKFSKRVSENEMKEENDSLTNVIPNTLIKALTDEESKQKRERLDGLEIGWEKFSSSFINESLQNTGKITKLEITNTSSWYILQQLYDMNNPENTVIGIFVIKFEPTPILKDFLSKCNLKIRGFQEKIENYEINYAFIPTEKNEKTSKWFGSKNITDEVKDFCLLNPQSSQKNLGNTIIIKKKNQEIPHLAIATITETQTFNNN